MSQDRNRLKKTASPKNAYSSQLPLRSFDSLKKTSMKKEAAFGMGSMGIGGGGGSVIRVNPKPYSPIYDESYLMLPRDRRELNQWCRHFYTTDPIIRNALDLHSRYPLAKFDIRCPYPKIRNFFQGMAEDINLHEIILAAGLEYWKIGEVIVEAQLNKEKGVWEQLHIHNPDYIDIQNSLFVHEPSITLIPDDETRRIIKSPGQADHAIRNQIDPEVIQYVMTGQNIPLNNFNVSYIVNKASPYDKRGTSILECLFKDLMLRDKYREAQYVIADSHVTPLRIFKVGDEKYRPTEPELNAFRDTLEQAMYDPNFTIVYHGGLTVEYVGSNGVVLDLSSEYERLERMMWIGLFTNQAIGGGEGPAYGADQIALDVLQQRYISFRQRIEHWVERKIFKPISEINEFYEYDPDSGDKKLIVPQISWHKINLKTNKDYIDTLIGLAEAKKCSYTRIFGFLDLDLNEELETIEEEQRKIKKLENAIAAMGGPPESTETPPSTESTGGLDLGETGPAMPPLEASPEPMEEAPTEEPATEEEPPTP